jgi:hypothetical protein
MATSEEDLEHENAEPEGESEPLPDDELGDAPQWEGE